MLISTKTDLNLYFTYFSFFTQFFQNKIQKNFLKFTPTTLSPIFTRLDP